MALQGSGAISASDLSAEFSGSAPETLSDYYRGGVYVPNIAANSGIPTSGQIALSDFYSSTAYHLETTLTIGGSDPYGFLNGSYGSMGSNSFGAYTIAQWTAGAAGNMTLWLSGAGIPNTDSVFRWLVLPIGSPLFRDTAFYDGAAGGGSFTSWFWTTAGVNKLGTSGTVNVKVRA